MKNIFVSNHRFNSIVWIVLFAFICIFLRLFYLHVWHGEALQKIAESNRYKFEILYGRRGDICDQKGTILATTRPMIVLGLDPQLLQESDQKKWHTLAQYANLQLEDIQHAASQKTYISPQGDTRLVRWKKLAESIDDPTYQRIMDLKIKGVYGNRIFERVYPSNTQAAHILGFVNKESQASGGIEQAMDFYLKGQDGWIETQCDGRRRELSQFRTRCVDPEEGYTVELTLDVNIQHILEEAIQVAIDKYHPHSITIIVTNPQTGFILGLANYPTFDPNHYNQYPIETHRNRAITDIYEPGSVFKIVAASGVINEHLVGLEDVFDCRESIIKYKGRTVKLPKDYRPMGLLKTGEVIAHSSNRGVAQFAMKLGDERMYQYCKRFGFGQKTLLGLPGEVNGMLHPVKKWDGLTISRLPMGHAVCVTPLQMHMAMGSIANNGVLMKPQVVQRIQDKQGNTIVQFSPKTNNRVITPKTAETIKKFLDAKTVKIAGISTASKTGTSQKIIDGHYSHNQHIASCSGFLPVENPQVQITVVIDDPHIKGTGYGSIVATPVFKQVAEKLVYYLGIH